MPNGKPGDHPLTDILTHGIGVYGEEADQLIRKISSLCSRNELDAWWDEKIAWSGDLDIVLFEARAYHETVLQRARSHGWETEE
ncbi:MAG: hypothetical protein ACC645_14520 [Pirellulales bacterium]